MRHLAIRKDYKFQKNTVICPKQGYVKKGYSARTNMPDWYEKDRESLARYTQTQSCRDGILINEEETW